MEQIQEPFQIAPKPQEPGVLVVHLLDRCNLRCRHCYMEGGPGRSRVLPEEVVVRSLEDAEGLGIRTAYLTGGEPLLHPQFSTILSRAQERGGDLELAICTNGTLVTAAEAARIARTRARAQVSIDGREPYHDTTRGRAGSFEAARAGIAALVDAGVPVTIVITLCRENQDCLPWLADWALAVGAERVSVQPLLQIGRAARMKGSALDDGELCVLFLRLSDLGHRYRPRGLRFSLHYRSTAYLRAHPCVAYVCNGAGCHRLVRKEIKSVVIREDGAVLPEIPTLDPRFAMGSVLEARLSHLVERYMSRGYDAFHSLCRTVFAEVVPTYRAPIIPWEELVSQRSWTFDAAIDGESSRGADIGAALGRPAPAGRPTPGADAQGSPAESD
jgi:MoaA/NifB/PqqE/SkfB family radical SAM enzyme